MGGMMDDTTTQRKLHYKAIWMVVKDVLHGVLISLTFFVIVGVTVGVVYLLGKVFGISEDVGVGIFLAGLSVFLIVCLIAAFREEYKNKLFELERRR